MDNSFGLPLDTDLETLRQYYAVIRSMTPEERVQQSFRLSERVRKLTEAGRSFAASGP